MGGRLLMKYKNCLLILYQKAFGRDSSTSKRTFSNPLRQRMFDYNPKYYMNRILLSLILIVSVLPFCTSKASAQIIGVHDQEEYVDSLIHNREFGPFFGLYKDTYFIVGTNPTHKPTGNNSNVKFQISFAVRLTDRVLPWGTYIFLSYTQKAIWNVFQESMPMRDLNFNPGLGWSKPFFSKNRYVGKLTMMLEHESNGRDGLDSRSWNKISFSGSALVNDWLMVHSKYWIPIIDSGNNKDILKYSGIFQSGLVVNIPKIRLSLGVTMVKRKGWNLNANTIWEASWKVSPESNLNLFAQYYNGYGENLLDYNQFRSMARIGICFKPQFFSEF